MENKKYNSTKWKKKRLSILRRDKYLCQRCKRFGRNVAATTVHHIKHWDEFPELAFSNENLMSVCYQCHAYFHPEKGGKKGKKRFMPPLNQ